MIIKNNNEFTMITQMNLIYNIMHANVDYIIYTKH